MNPSSYAYLDELRPTESAFAAHADANAPGYQAPAPEHVPPPFAHFHDAESCTGFDRWPYGLKDRNGYAAKVSDEVLKKQVVERPTTYLAGEYDILPLHGFDWQLRRHGAGQHAPGARLRLREIHRRALRREARGAQRSADAATAAAACWWPASR